GVLRPTPPIKTSSSPASVASTPARTPEPRLALAHESPCSGKRCGGLVERFKVVEGHRGQTETKRNQFCSSHLFVADLPPPSHSEDSIPSSPCVRHWILDGNRRRRALSLKRIDIGVAMRFTSVGKESLELLKLLFASLLIVPIAFGQTTLTTAQIAKKVSPSVVVIQGKTDSGDVLGSGFIVSKDGKIVTNLPVIRDMKTASVQFANGETFHSVSVLAIDERRDLAIVKGAGFEPPVSD